MATIILLAPFLDIFSNNIRAEEMNRNLDEVDVINVSWKSEQENQIQWEVSINQAGINLDSNVVYLEINNSHQLLLDEFKEMLDQNNIILESVSSDGTKVEIRLPDKESKFTLLFQTRKKIDVKANYELHAYLIHQEITYEAQDRVSLKEDIKGNLTYNNTPINIEAPPTRVYLVNQITGMVIAEQTLTSENESYLFESTTMYDDLNRKIPYSVFVDPLVNYKTEIDGYNISHTYHTIEIKGNIDNKSNQDVTLNLVDLTTNSIVSTQNISAEEDMYIFKDLSEQNIDGTSIDYAVEAEEVDGLLIESNGFDFTISEDYVNDLPDDKETDDLQRPDKTTSEQESEAESIVEVEDSSLPSAEQVKSIDFNNRTSLLIQSQPKEYIFTKSSDIRYRRGLMANDVIGTINAQLNSEQTEITWTINFSFSGSVYNPTVQLNNLKLSDGLQFISAEYNNKNELTLGNIDLGEIKPSKNVIIKTKITNRDAPLLRLDIENVISYDTTIGSLWAQYQMKTQAPTVGTVTNLSDSVVGNTEPNAIIIIRNSSGTEIGRTIATSGGAFSASIPQQGVDTLLTITAQAPGKTVSNAQTINVAYDPATPLNNVVVEDFYDIETGIRGTSDEGTTVTIRDINGKILGSSNTIMTNDGPRFYVDIYQTLPAGTELIAVAHSSDGKISNETRFIVKATENGILPPNVYSERQNPYPNYDGSKGIETMSWDEREKYRNRSPQSVEYAEGFLWKYAKPSSTEDTYEVNLKTQGRSDVNTAPLDIVLVIDNSGSMSDKRWFNSTRWESMEAVLYPFIEDMTRSNLNTRFAIVNYAANIVSQSDFSSDYNTIRSSIPNGPQNPLSSSAGTFTQLGLRTGASYIEKARPDAEKVLILLTDGAPTYSYKGTAATSAENITVFSNELLGRGTSFNLTEPLEFLYQNYSINGINIRNHGQATISEAKTLKSRLPKMKVFGVGLDLDLDTHYSNTQQRTYVLEQIASQPEYAFNTSNILDSETGLKRILDTITERVSKSISGGVVTDPIGEMYDLDLGEDGKFNVEDYVLTASHPELLNSNVAPEYDPVTRTISLSGLTLGAGEWVNIKYKVKLRTDDLGFVDNKWYPMNGLTYLTPTRNAEEIREYPVPEAKSESPVYNFEFIKTDENGKQLEGATFTLSNPISTFEATSNNEGVVLFSGLKPGNYELRESEAPTGYKIDETIYNVSINRQGVINVNDKVYDNQYPFKVINQLIPKNGTITLIKHDSVDENMTLGGAKFELKSIDGSYLHEEFTDENGMIIFNEVPFGEYELTEKKSPNGYQLDQTPITVIVNEDNIIQEIKVENTKLNLPHTGGIGTVFFTLFGTLLMLLAWIYRKYTISQ